MLIAAAAPNLLFVAYVDVVHDFVVYIVVSVMSVYDHLFFGCVMNYCVASME